MRLPRTAQNSIDHDFVKLDEVRRLATLEINPSDLALRRDQAAAAMLFLSGMRGGAFASLTIECVNLADRTIKQWPSLGIKTKNRKSATTFLLDIPDLIAVVENWDAFVRTRLPMDAPWYPPVTSQWGEQVLSMNAPGENRNIALAKRMRKLFSMAGLPYRSPHKFRHGHAVFALQHANTMADYKAVSMNLMHADIRVTDGIYAPLARDEVKERIAGLTVETLSQKAMDGKDVLTTHRLSDDELLIALARRLNSLAPR